MVVTVRTPGGRQADDWLQCHSTLRAVACGLRLLQQVQPSVRGPPNRPSRICVPPSLHTPDRGVDGGGSREVEPGAQGAIPAQLVPLLTTLPGSRINKCVVHPPGLPRGG